MAVINSSDIQLGLNSISNATTVNSTLWGVVDSGDAQRTLSVDQLLMIYILPVIIVAGTLGNALSAIVLFRSRMRIVSVYLYLLLLAFADTTVLYTSAFKTWLRLLVGVEWLHSSDMACRTLTFLFLASLHFSAWLVVLTTMDRFVAVWYPLKAATFCSHQRARLAAGLLLLATVLFDGHLFWTVRLQYLEAMGSDQEEIALMLEPSCRPDPDPAVASFMYGPFEYLKLATYNVIPFVIIVTLNLAIIVKLRLTSPSPHGQRPSSTHSQHSQDQDSPAIYCCHKVPKNPGVDFANEKQSTACAGQRNLYEEPTPSSSGQSTTGVSDSNKRNHRSSSNDPAANKDEGFIGLRRHTGDSTPGGNILNVIQSRITTMLLTVSFVWLTLTTPFTVSGFLFAVVDLSVETTVQLMPFKAVSFLLMYSNHAVNFYLYCLTGKKFRRELIETFASARNWCSGNHHHVTSCTKGNNSSRTNGRSRSNTIEITSSRFGFSRKSDV